MLQLTCQVLLLLLLLRAFIRCSFFIFVVLHKKCENSATVSLILILNLISRAVKVNDGLGFSRFLPMAMFRWIPSSTYSGRMT